MEREKEEPTVPQKTPEQRLAELLEIGRRRGRLTPEELESLNELDADVGMLEKFFDTLDAEKIDFTYPPDPFDIPYAALNIGEIMPQMLYEVDSLADGLAEDDALRLLLRELREVPVLRPDEEQALQAKIAEGDESAKRHLLEANLRLVVYIAKPHFQRWISPIELIENGVYGLVEAGETFDYIGGGSFSAYAAQLIRREIDRAVESI